MSTVKIQGNSGGSGSVTVASPNTNSNRTISLPDADGSFVTADASGNVGIGTTSPGAKLQVSSANSALIGLINGTTRGIRIGSDSTASYIEGVDNTGSVSFQPLVLGGANVRFTLSGAECARFETGNLLIGLTSLAYTTARLMVSAASGSGAYIATSYAGDVGTPGIWVSKYDNNSTTSQILVKFNINNNNNGSGQINANGANSAAFGAWSDRRLKENIQDLPPQLANICALRPVEFDYIKSEGGGHQIGFIAQEMQEVYPDVVGERAPDGMLTVTGWSKTEARLVKAIQEQQAIIEQLKADVAALKGAK